MIRQQSYIKSQVVSCVICHQSRASHYSIEKTFWTAKVALSCHKAHRRYRARRVSRGAIAALKQTRCGVSERSTGGSKRSSELMMVIAFLRRYFQPAFIHPNDSRAGSAVPMHLYKVSPTDLARSHHNSAEV